MRAPRDAYDRQHARPRMRSSPSTGAASRAPRSAWRRSLASEGAARGVRERGAALLRRAHPDAPGGRGRPRRGRARPRARARVSREDVTRHRLRRGRDTSAGIASPSAPTASSRSSYVRDPEATDEQHAYALRTLGERRSALATPDPIRDADYAEALSRAPGRHDEAYAILEPLAKKDLVGSPNALGALFRVAKERGDEPTAVLREGALRRHDWREPDLSRRLPAPSAHPRHHALVPPARAARARRSRLSRPSLATARARRHAREAVDRCARRGSGTRPRLQALALLGGAFYVFARATAPTWTAIVFAALLALTFAVERRAFFAAVRRGRIAGLVLRPAGPDDAHLPSLAIYRIPSGGPHARARACRRRSARLPRGRTDASPPARAPPSPSRAGFALATVVALVALFGAFAFVPSARGP